MRHVDGYRYKNPHHGRGYIRGSRRIRRSTTIHARFPGEQGPFGHDDRLRYDWFLVPTGLFLIDARIHHIANRWGQINITHAHDFIVMEEMIERVTLFELARDRKGLGRR